LKTRFRKFLRVTERLLAVTGLMFVIYHSGFDLAVMVSPSMSPTLQGTSYENGDWILNERVSGWFRSPRRWEVIVFRDHEGVLVTKRVVALPGETVAIKQLKVHVNGRELAAPASLGWLKHYAYGNVSGGQTFTVTNGYYVLGDDSKDSQDSRFEGVVAPEKVLSRAWAVVWPLSRIRWVNP
jgi:signal peptidase I